MLTWEKLSDRTYRARLPIFGNVRVESYSEAEWEVNFSAPGVNFSLSEDRYGSAADARNFANKIVADACRDFLDQASTVRGVTV